METRSIDYGVFMDCNNIYRKSLVCGGVCARIVGSAELAGGSGTAIALCDICSGREFGCCYLITAFPNLIPPPQVSKTLLICFPSPAPL